MSGGLTMVIDLDQPVTLSDALVAARSFWHWWTTELMKLLPPRWHGFAQELIERPIAKWRDGQWLVRLPTVAAFVALRSMDASVSAKLGQLGPLRVELSSDEILLRRVTLPSAAESRLRGAVALQIEKLSPFLLEEVAFDVSVLERRASEIFVE